MTATTGPAALAADIASIARRGMVLRSDLASMDADLAVVERIARNAGYLVVDDVVDPQRSTTYDASASDPVRQYLDAVGQVDLLTAESETDLAKRYAAGRAAEAYLSTRSDLSPDLLSRLQSIACEGQRAQDVLIRSNLRLVISVAKRYRGRGLDLLDLVQEGNLGLMRAVEKFDHTRGYKFSTYATWWIRQALTRGIADKSRTMRLPVHVHDLLGKLHWKELQLLQEHGREPTEAELAAAVDLTVDRMRELRNAARDLLSLDTPVGAEGDTTFGSLIEDDSAIDPERELLQRAVRDAVEHVLTNLDERERGILRMRYGLVADGEEDIATLEEVGLEFGVTRERIRQIEARTISKLRATSARSKLDGLLEDAAAS